MKKIVFLTTVSAPVEEVELMFSFSPRALKMFPDITDVFYVKGNDREQKVGTIISFTQTYKGISETGTCETLEYAPGVKAVYKSENKNSQLIMSIWYSAVGAKTDVCILIEYKLKSYFSILSPFVRDTISAFYLKRINTVVQHFGSVSPAQVSIETYTFFGSNQLWKRFLFNFILLFCILYTFKSTIYHF